MEKHTLLRSSRWFGMISTKKLQKPSEYWTSLVFKWWICVQYSNGGLKTGRKSLFMFGIQMVRQVTWLYNLNTGQPYCLVFGWIQYSGLNPSNIKKYGKLGWIIQKPKIWSDIRKFFWLFLLVGLSPGVRDSDGYCTWQLKTSCKANKMFFCV